MGEKICNCTPHPMLTSPIDLYCGKCEGRLLALKITRQLDEFNLETTSGDASRLPDGRLREAAAAGTPNSSAAGTRPGSLVSRREFVIALAGAVAGALLSPFGDRIKLRLGWLADEERERLSVIASELLEDQIKVVELALERGENLRQLASIFTGDGRYAASIFAEAVADHSEGTSAGRAVAAYQHLLNNVSSPVVREALLFRRSKALVMVGSVQEALNDLNQILQMDTASEPIKRITYLRQAMNHSYILLTEAQLSKPEEWELFRKYLGEALIVLDIDGDDFGDPEKRLRTAVNFHPALGPGILVFEAIINAARNVDSRRESLRSLQIHQQLLRAISKADSVTGWNRYTPLAAQAIRLGHLEFAGDVLREAAEEANKPGSYANRQKEANGAEWLIHLSQRGILALATGQAEVAHSIFVSLLDSKFANVLSPFLRPISAYASLAKRAVSPDAAPLDLRVGLMNVWYDSHAAYFPNWSDRVW